MSDADVKMPDKAVSKVTVTMDATLARRLKWQSRRAGRTPSETIRRALDAYLENVVEGVENFHDVAKRRGAIGSVKGLPKNLSTNPKHLEGFGE